MSNFGKIKRISDDRLMPCPFCGEDGEVVIYTKSDGIEKYYVGCTNEKCGCELVRDPFYDLDKCMEAWNTRRLVKEDGQWVVK